MRVVVVFETDCSTREHAFTVVQRTLEYALCHAPAAMHIQNTPAIVGVEAELAVRGLVLEEQVLENLDAAAALLRRAQREGV